MNCIDVSWNGEFLAAGYFNNLVVIWDLKKFKVFYELDKTHEDSVDYVKFLS